MCSSRMFSALVTLHLVWLVGATKLSNLEQILESIKSSNTSVEPSSLFSSFEAPLKNLTYKTSKNRLALPPGTLLVLTPALQLPVYRNLPVGYGSHMTVSIPFSINFDDLGMTSEENPWGLWPDFDWIGGDRKFMYAVLEDALGKIGVSGKECLLRTICEFFETPLLDHGFLAELLELFFTVSNTPKAETTLAEYLEAEKLGKDNKSCAKYYSGCGKSLFLVNGENKKKQTRVPKATKLGNLEKLLKSSNSSVDSNHLSIDTSSPAIGSSSSTFESAFNNIFHITHKNRLVLPPGMSMYFVASLSLPVYRNAPLGFGSQMDISIPFSIHFDDLGMTSEENSWGLWPESNMVGGHRVFMFKYLEDVLGKVGIKGKECLLRAICESFESPLDNHGLLAELMELFFTVSNTPEAETLLAEYLEAEKLGKQNKSCSKFYSGCGTSLFSVNGQNKKKQTTIPEADDKNTKRP